MSSDAEFAKQQDGARLRAPRCVALKGRPGKAVQVSSHVQISDTTPALVSEKKIKKGQMAPALYVPDKKWKVILRFDTRN